MFQSTHPHGVRLDRVLYLIYIRRVSIHAPARGATGLLALGQKPKWVFQSTHPHGVRHAAGRIETIGDFSFNPRTRTGCDLSTSIASPACGTFQSTHPHGVRRLRTRDHAR